MTSDKRSQASTHERESSSLNSTNFELYVATIVMSSMLCMALTYLLVDAQTQNSQ